MVASDAACNITIRSTRYSSSRRGHQGRVPHKFLPTERSLPLDELPVPGHPPPRCWGAMLLSELAFGEMSDRGIK